MTFQVIDDFLPADDYKNLLTYVQGQPMHYGSKSNGKTDPHGHWSWKPIHDNQKNLADLTYSLPDKLLVPWRYVKHRAGLGDVSVIRCYANGYTYGTDGYFHTDSDRTDEHTIIIYMCDKWEPDWAGETVAKSADGNYGCLPAPNRALIIPSNALHAARAVSRKCTVLRTTLMFKTRPRRSQEFEALSNFLVEKGALKLEHSKGTLHDHLVRVFALLEARDSDTYQIPVSLRYGGGLHSIYGTNVYQKQLVVPSPNARGMVASQFGTEAEALAYLFSVIERPATLEKAAGFVQFGPPAPYLLQMRHDQKMSVTPGQLQNLCLIECANLLDQDSLHKWPNLKKLWEVK